MKRRTHSCHSSRRSDDSPRSARSGGTPAVRRLLCTALALGLALVGRPLLAADSVLAITNATLHPVTSEPFAGHVLIEDGLITAVGPEIDIPAEATVVDATGLDVYPGLTDALSQVGLVEINAVAATDDQAEMGIYNPHLRAASAVHPASEVIPVTRANGLTHVVVAPETDGEGVIAGQAALIHLDGWTIEEMAIDPSIAMVIDWPEIVTRRFDFSTFSMKESPYAEAKEKAEERQNELRDWLDAARHYRQAMAAGSERLERNLELEALAEVLDGAKPVLILAHEEREIRQALAFAEEQELRMILGGGEEAWKVGDLLAEKGIPVILAQTQSLPDQEDDPYDTPFGNPGKLVAAGVKIAFASGAGGGFGPGGPHGARTTPYEAATAVPYGLPAEAALKALTLWPAEILGVADRLGSIEPGKLANLIVTDGDPLAITTTIEHLVIAGHLVSSDNKHRRLYETYRAR